MLFRFEIGSRGELDDAPALRVKNRIRDFLQLPLADCRLVKVYTVSGLDLEQLQSLYLTIPAGGQLQEACEAYGMEQVGQDGRTCVYRTR